MAGRALVIDRLKLSYEGLFNQDEFYSVIAQFFFDKGWDWYEKMNEVLATPKGRNIRIIFEPWKNISDYYQITVRIKILMSGIKEVEVKHDGQALRVNQGEIKVVIDGFVVSDRKNKWLGTPMKWFANLLISKYFFKEHYKKAEDWLKSDVDDLHQQIKTYLNTFRYTYGR